MPPRQLPLSVLIARYACFAGIAIGANLACQNIVLLALHGQWFTIYLAIAIGNVAGLCCKYVLDKFWIFNDLDQSIRANARKFLLYSTFGALTSMIFWGTELAFHYIFNTHLMTNVGAVVGLVIGYAIKFQLDFRFTFNGRPPKETAD